MSGVARKTAPAVQRATHAAPAVIDTPRSFDVELTARCNSRCVYCFFFDNDAVEYRDLPTADWLGLFDECGRLGVMRLCLAGGEPFMRPDLPELIDGIRRNRMRYGLLSNGSLVDDSIADILAASGRCDYVQVSIDGPAASVHDASRGAGSFAAAVRGLECLRRHGVPVTVRVTIQHHNVAYLRETAAFLLDELRLPGFSTNSAGYLGSCRRHADDVLLDVAERQLAMETLVELSERYPGRITAQAGPLAEARMWGRMLRDAREARPPLPDRGRLSACGCSRTRLAVRADGSVVICTMLPHAVLGHIGRDDLHEIWLRHPLLVAHRRRREIPLADFQMCRDCPYIDHCTGNCPGLAYTHTGEIDHPSPDACLRLFLEQGGRVPETAGV